MNPGDVLGARFELIEPIAEGGMSVLWSARDRRSDDVVAVKVVENATRGAIDRFGREVRVLARLNHPHIVRYLAHGSIGVGSVFLAMERLEGEALDNRIERGTLSVTDTLTIAQRLAEALAEAHRNGVVHRDIKPSNIFLRDGMVSRATLLDFGIVRMVMDTSITPTGQPMGTTVYMAPEQAKGSAKHGPPADVYALGATMFKCLTGRPLFEAVNVMGVLAKVLLEAPPKLRELRPDAPEELERLLDRMLAKKPEERLADGFAAAQAIAKLAAAEPRRLTSRPPPARSLFPELEQGSALSVVLFADPELGGPASRRPASELRSWRTAAADVAKRHGGFSELLSEGTPVVVLRGDDHPNQLATRAIEVALELREALPDVALGIATVVGGEPGVARSLVGSGIDVASAMLMQVVPRPGDVCLDAFTAEIAEDAGHGVLAADNWFVLDAI